jgi:transposase InsO family protein
VDRIQTNCFLDLNKAVEFVQEIMFRIKIPNSIITDLGSNFTSSEFFDFCEQGSIQIKYALVAHPRANGQVERANRMILDALQETPKFSWAKNPRT